VYGQNRTRPGRPVHEMKTLSLADAGGIIPPWCYNALMFSVQIVGDGNTRPPRELLRSLLHFLARGLYVIYGTREHLRHKTSVMAVDRLLLHYFAKLYQLFRFCSVKWEETCKVKVKLSLCLTKYHTIQTYCGSGGIPPWFLNLGTRWMWMVSIKSRLLLTPE
jgi:hypothetical protein